MEEAVKQELLLNRIHREDELVVREAKDQFVLSGFMLLPSTFQLVVGFSDRNQPRQPKVVTQAHAKRNVKSPSTRMLVNGLGTSQYRGLRSPRQSPHTH